MSTHRVRSMVLVTWVLLFAAIWWFAQQSSAVQPTVQVLELSANDVPQKVDRGAPPDRVAIAPAPGPVPVDSAAAEVALVVEVVDDRGAAVPGARVTVVDEHSATLVSDATDGAGTLTCRLRNRRACLSVQVEAEGRAGRDVDVGIPVPSRMRVVLASPAVLRGTVVTSRGVPAPSGTRVFGWSPRTISLQDLARRLQTGTGLLTARTEADGSFELRGVRPASHYTVVSGCSGWICEEPQRFGSDQTCRLVMRPVYGCRVNARLTGGGEAPASLAFVVRHHAPDLPSVEELESSSIGLMVAGVLASADSGPEKPFDWRDLTFVCAADEEAAALPGFRIDYSVPGIESRSFELALPRLQNEWQRVVADLRPIALGFADLEVVLLRQTGDVRGFDGISDFKIEFVPLSAPEHAYAAPLYIRDGRAVVPGVPLGVYDVRVSSPFGWSFPATGRTQIEVRPGGSRMEIPANTFGSVVVTLTNHDATTMSNALTLDLWLGGSASARRQSCWGPRIVLHGVRPGLSRLQLGTERDEGKAKTTRVEVEVPSGGIREVDLAWEVR